MAELALQISNLNVSLRGRTVLEDVNLSLEQGSFMGLIGPNGAGKTVLLKTILGLIKPNAGEILVFGRTPKQARGSIGYVPQYARFDADFPMSVLETVLIGRLRHTRIFGSYTNEDIQVAEQVLAKVDLLDLRNQHIGKLSGGQLQRVLIARALALQPKMLLLDEPTASLDTRVGRTVYEILEELSKVMTIVLVSHDIGVIASHVKTIACLNRKLHYHHSKELSSAMLEEVYGCPVELLAHGHAHRVLGEHHHHHHEDSEK